METNSNQVTLVDNIPGNVSSLTEFDGQVYFSAGDEEYGSEPWISDGTAAGTQILRDIEPGSSSNPVRFTEFDGKIYFNASLHELWSTDGTTEGTNLVAEVNADGGVNYSLNNFTAFNGRLYFGSITAEGDSELWSTDGTTEGTSLFEGVIPVGTTSIEFDDRLYFNAIDGSRNNFGLWSIDGTAEGTSLITADVTSVSRDFIEFDDKLYFGADNDLNGVELWSSDGTTAGTSLAVDIIPGANGSNPDNFIEFNNQLYFTTTDSSGDGLYSQVELWSSDGTTAGTNFVADINPGINNNLSSFVEFDGKLYFSATDEIHGTELWSTDGTSEGTSLVTDIIPGAENSSPVELVEFDGKLYFTITNNTGDTLYNNELWSSDGTAAGTNFVMDLHPGYASSSAASYGGAESLAARVGSLTIVDNELFFTAYSNEFGTELLKITADDTAVNNIIGSDSTDNIVGSVDSDRIEGLRGNDTLSGGSKNDVLIGGEGNDILIGGNGFDTLEGSLGSDIFVLQPGQIKDTITDFDLEIDKLGLADGLELEDLTFVGSTISLGNENLVQLDNINAENLTVDNFLDL